MRVSLSYQTWRFPLLDPSDLLGASDYILFIAVGDFWASSVNQGTQS